MVRAHTKNNLVLLAGAILAEDKGDMWVWGLNLSILPKETLYQLQDGVTVQLHAREGHALQVLMEHKKNIEQVSLQSDHLVTRNKKLEHAMLEVCSNY